MNLSTAIDAHADVKYKEGEKENTDYFHCKFYGDIQLDQNPTNYEEAKEVYKDFPNLVKKKDEKGRSVTVPKRVWLYPLSFLDSKAERLVREVDDGLISQAQDLMQDLHELEMRANDLMEVCEYPPGIREHLTKFREIITDYGRRRQQDLKAMVPQIRSGDEEKEQQLVQIFNDFAKYLHRMSCWLGQKEEEVKLLKVYLDDMEGIEFASSPSDLYAAINKYKYVLCFAIKNSGKEDPNFPNESSEDSDDPPKPWYRIPEFISDAKRKAKQFKAFALAIKEKKDLKCLIDNTSDRIPKGKSAAITLYRDGAPEEYEPPSEPGKPTVTYVAAYDTKVQWAKPSYGAQNVTFYTISYRPSSDEIWFTCATEGVKEEDVITTTKIGFEHIFKINAECDIGSSADSDTCTFNTIDGILQSATKNSH